MYHHLQKYSNVTKRGYYLNNVHSIVFFKAQELQKLLLFSSTDIRVPVLFKRASCIKADSHIACRAHAAPMPFPCHAVPLRV